MWDRFRSQPVESKVKCYSHAEAIWFIEGDLKAWFEANPGRRLAQSFKAYLMSRYPMCPNEDPLFESDVLDASRRVRRLLRV